MLGHFGFSYIGLIWLLMLFAPNLIWLHRQPKGYDPKEENQTLVLLERMGQVLVTVCALCFSDFNFKPFSLWSLWLLASFLLLLLYELWWLRYYKSGQTRKDFYSSLYGIPVAGATLPVLAFLCLGIYGKVLWMLFAVALLGIGHIGIHLQHAKAR